MADLEKRIKDRVREETSSAEYAAQVAFIVSRARVSPYALEAALNKDNFCHKTSKLFPIKQVGGGAHNTLSPYIEKDDPTLVSAENDTPDAVISKGDRFPRLVLGADCQGVGELFDVVKMSKRNEHIHTSLLKRWLSCLIVANDWFSVSLTNQPWLNHRGTGGLVIVGAFVTSYVARYLDQIVESGCTFLFVTEQYTPGLYVGDEYCYYCDERGTVLGTSRGAPTKFWTDKSDPWGSVDYYKNYSIETLACFGPQRVVLIKPTDKIIVPVQYVTIPRPTLAGKGTLTPAKEPNSLCGLVRIRPEKEEAPSVDDYAEADLEDAANIALIDCPEDHYYVRMCEHPAEHPGAILTIASTLVLALINYYSLIPSYMVLIPIVAAAPYYVLKWMRRPNEDFQVILKGYGIHFYGKHAEALRAWYKANPVDPVTKLPYGWYKVTDLGIVQVRQGSHNADYTNVPRLISAFCASHNWPQTSNVSHYLEMTTAVAPVFKFKGDFEIMTQYDPEIKSKMLAYKVKINAPVDNGVLSIHLSNDDEYREFVGACVNENTLQRSAERVARPGIRSIYPWEHFRALLRDLWEDQKLDRIETVDSDPDLSRYSGKKWKKYDSAFTQKAGFSDEAGYTTFVKQEALPPETVTKKGNRIITMNNAAFNVTHLNWFHVFEEKILSIKDKYTGLPLIAKGLNTDERYRVIQELCGKFTHFASIDFKNCDGHFSGPSYEGVVRFFADIGLDHEIVSQILDAKTFGVIEYQHPQQRSGDLYTGSGNCAIVAAMLYQFVTEDFTFFCDGDDTLLFFNIPTIVKDVETMLNRLGFEISIEENRAIDNSNNSDMVVPFCQTYYTVHGYHVDLHRRLNKLCNITASNALMAARVILGKLQGLELLGRLGVNLHMDVAPLIHGKAENEDVVHAEEMFAGMENYQSNESIDFDLSDPKTGLIAKAACAIRDDIMLKFMRKVGRKETRTYHKRVLHVLTNLVNRTLQFDTEVPVPNHVDEEKIARYMSADRVSMVMAKVKRR